VVSIYVVSRGTFAQVFEVPWGQRIIRIVRGGGYSVGLAIKIKKKKKKKKKMGGGGVGVTIHQGGKWGGGGNKESIRRFT